MQRLQSLPPDWYGARIAIPYRPAPKTLHISKEYAAIVDAGARGCCHPKEYQPQSLCKDWIDFAGSDAQRRRMQEIAVGSRADGSS